MRLTAEAVNPSQAADTFIFGASKQNQKPHDLNRYSKLIAFGCKLNLTKADIQRTQSTPRETLTINSTSSNGVQHVPHAFKGAPE